MDEQQQQAQAAEAAVPFLSPEERTILVDKLKAAVVYISCLMPHPEGLLLYDEKDTPPAMPKKYKPELDWEYRSSGFYIDSQGTILTCAHCVPSNRRSLSYTEYNDVTDTDIMAKMSFKIRCWDLAILTPLVKPTKLTPFLSLASDSVSINTGMEVVHIGHPLRLDFTSLFGQTSFPSIPQIFPPLSDVRLIPTISNASPTPTTSIPFPRTSRYVGDIIDNENNKSLDDLHPLLPTIQVNNLHMNGGSWGSPLLDTRGRVIGICSFIANGFSFAIHFKVLKNFLQLFHQQQETERKSITKRKSQEGGGSSSGSGQGDYMHIPPRKEYSKSSGKRGRGREPTEAPRKKQMSHLSDSANCGTNKKMMDIFGARSLRVWPILCDLCNVKCDTLADYEGHLDGEKHIFKLNQFKGHLALLGLHGMNSGQKQC